jgi:multidrug resistance efflux pump
MSDHPDNSILDLLRAIQADIASLRDRLTALEIQISDHGATENSHYANPSLHLDRMESQLERIEHGIKVMAAPPTESTS